MARTLNAEGSYTQTGEAAITTINGWLFADSTDIQGGMLSGAGEINGLLRMSGGQLEPGNSSGTLHVTGDYEQTGGTLVMQLESLAAFGQLWIHGNASLGGILQVLLNDYTPTPGDTFDLLHWGGGRCSASLAATSSRSCLRG